MLTKVIRVDSNGLFVEDVLLEKGQEVPRIYVLKYF